jgi:hypothetical protein
MLIRRLFLGFLTQVKEVASCCDKDNGVSIPVKRRKYLLGCQEGLCAMECLIG